MSDAIQAFAYDLAALVRGQDAIVDRLDQLIAAIEALGDRLVEALDEDVEREPGCATDAVTPRERAEYWRNTGEYYGYPDCCIEAFIAHAEAGGRQSDDEPRPPTHPQHGYMLCDACARDPERAERVGTAARRQRIAPEEVMTR